MADEKNDKPDAVNRDDYNKVVESHNSAKADLEKIQKEKDEIAKKLEETSKSSEEMKKKLEEANKWKEQAEAEAKQKKELEEKLDNKPNPKGLVPPQQDNPQQGRLGSDEQVKKIKDHFGEMDTKILRPQPNIKVYGHYLNPSADPYDNHTFGELLSLHGEYANQMGIPPEAGRSSDDWVVHKGTRRAT